MCHTATHCLLNYVVQRTGADKTTTTTTAVVTVSVALPITCIRYLISPSCSSVPALPEQPAAGAAAAAAAAAGAQPATGGPGRRRACRGGAEADARGAAAPLSARHPGDAARAHRQGGARAVPLEQRGRLPQPAGVGRQRRRPQQQLQRAAHARGPPLAHGRRDGDRGR